MTARTVHHRPRALLACALLVACASCAAHHGAAKVAPTSPKANDATLEHVESFYNKLLAIRRPDLAASYALPEREETFEPLSESDLAAHVQDLNLMLADLDKVAPSPHADTLRTRITRELLQYGPQGALRRDPLLWLDILQSAVNAAYGGAVSVDCDQVHRIEQRLRVFPEALRGASVLLKDAPLPDSAEFVQRIARFEFFLRSDLPVRTDACKDGRRLAEFAEADTLAAASLQQFRRSLAPGE